MKNHRKKAVFMIVMMFTVMLSACRAEEPIPRDENPDQQESQEENEAENIPAEETEPEETESEEAEKMQPAVCSPFD